jgi:hypothetical protein
VTEAQQVERPPETRGVAGSIPAGHILGSVAQGRAPGSYPGKRWLEPGRGHHLEGLPWARYPVSKTGGSSGLGGSTPSPSASGGMAELERQRVASAQAATTARRFESCCLRHRPVAQRLEQWASNPRAPVRSGPGCPCDATSFNGRTAGCYPANAGSTPAVAASQQAPCPDRLAVEDAGLSHRKRGFDSRSGYFTARPRTRLETRPGCLPGEAGSTPVEGVHLAVAQW